MGDTYDYEPVNGTELIEHVRRIAAENPEWVYHPDGGGAECKYADGKDYCPSTERLGCLIGQALIAMGVPESRLTEWDRRDVLVSVRDLILEGEITASDDETEWLYHVQAAQDVGHSWGKAITIADELVPQLNN